MAKRLAAPGIEFLEGGGECGSLIRSKDWSRTPLGNPAGWPQSLKTAVRIVLTSRQPMFVWWGKDLINIYNDPYRAIVGGKHPEALGMPAGVVWKEIWDQVGPRAKTVLQKNVGTYDEALLLIMHRYGYAEETYYTFSYSPIPGDDGEPAGIICANTDDTQKIINERQMTLLKELAATTSIAHNAKEACKLGAQAMQTNSHDLPFVIEYLQTRDHKFLELVGSAGIDRSHPAVRDRVSLGATAKPNLWLLDKAVHDNEPQYIDDVHLLFDNLPTGAWERPPFAAVVVPIGRNSPNSHSGAIVIGLNPYRLYDGNYKDFIKLMVGEINASIANAEAYDVERKRAESLAELDKAKTSFFSNVSHEFRTPLTLLMGPLQELLDLGTKNALSAETLDQLKIIHRNGLRLQKLVNTLLDFSRIEAGRTQAVFAPTDIAVLTTDLASNFRSAIEKAGMKLTISVPKNTCLAYVDKEMWEKIVLNLVSNAFKYTLHGTITVTLHDRPNTFVLEVKDTGIGIHKKDLSRLFERFHRIQGASARTNEGTGIGLSLVKELVALHKGELSVQSVYGKGTVFSVDLPKGFAHLPKDQVVQDKTSHATTIDEQYSEEALRWQVNDVDDQTELSDQFDREVTNRLGRNNSVPWVVIADDNADMRQYITRLLKRYYRITAVSDGQAALDLIRKSPPDLVVSDVMMQHLDGFGLLKALRSDPALSTMPVILLSARAGEEARIEGLAAGANDYLVKPFAARELLARINAHLEISHLREEAARGVLDERQRLFDLLMQAPAAIAIMRGPKHIIELVNPRYMELIGVNRDVLGKPIRVALPDIVGQGFYELLDKVYQTGESFIGNETLVQLDRQGTGRLEDAYVDFVYQPTRDEKGDVYGILVHAVEVTAQVRGRHTLALSEQRLRFMAESMPQMIFTTLPNGKFSYVSPQWQDYTGHTVTSLTTLQHDKPALIHADDITRVSKLWRHALQKEEPVEFEYRLRRSDGSYRWHICRINPQRDEHGHIVVWIGSATDIDDMKRSAEKRHELEVKTAALTEQRTQLLALNQAKDEFISLASHQLRTPATGVKQYIGMLLQGYAGEVTDDQRMFLQTAYESNERQITIVNDLLQVARIDAGKVILNKKPDNLGRIVKNVVNEHASQLAARDQKIVFRIRPPEMLVPIDGERLRMVIDNIIDNASKYTESHKSIHVTLSTTGKTANLAVRDEGVGMNASDVDRIFQKFSRLDNPLSNAAEGSGLGLYWAKKIVDLHNGSISVRSKLGQGSTITIRLPM